MNGLVALKLDIRKAYGRIEWRDCVMLKQDEAWALETFLVLIKP